MPSLFNKKSSMQQSHALNHQQISPIVLKDLQKTIDPHNHLPGKNNCQCQICEPGRFPQKPDLNIFRSNSKQASKWFKKLLDGLTVSGGITLKLFLPDILFVDGQSVQIYQTSRKDSRITKLSSLTPLKNIYPTFLKMRKQYKNLLEQNYNQKMLDKINPEYMHLKYFQKLVPSHFHDANQSKTLQNNKYQFKRYVLHNNPKYQIQQIQQHKINQKQPFCLIKYNDGNCQLLNQAEFQLFSLSPMPKLQQACFFQSYIKYKLQSQSIRYSQYTYSPTKLDQQLDSRAQRQVMILLGGINRYDDKYRDIQSLEQISIDLMFSNHKQYVDLMTYKIIHYLAMASRIYVSHIKLKWIVTDIGTIYLQEIMEMHTNQYPHRIIKYRIPIKNDSLDFYHSNNFVDIYKEMGRRKAINTLIIKKDLDHKTYQEIKQIIDPSLQTDIIQFEPPKSQRQTLPNVMKRSKVASSSASKTIDMTHKPPFSPTNYETIQPKRIKFHNFSTYEEHLKQHPQIVMKNRRYDNSTLGKYSQAPYKVQKVDKKINNHFIFNMSSQDYKVFGNPSQSKPHSTQRKSLGNELNQYLEKRKARISQSVLYNTFHQLNSQKLKEVSQTLNHQKIRKRYKLSSTLDEN